MMRWLATTPPRVDVEAVVSDRRVVGVDEAVELPALERLAGLPVHVAGGVGGEEVEAVAVRQPQVDALAVVLVVGEQVKRLDRNLDLAKRHAAHAVRLD